jgi:hypothetical protein
LRGKSGEGKSPSAVAEGLLVGLEGWPENLVVDAGTSDETFGLWGGKVGGGVELIEVDV